MTIVVDILQARKMKLLDAFSIEKIWIPKEYLKYLKTEDIITNGIIIKNASSLFVYKQLHSSFISLKGTH